MKNYKPKNEKDEHKEFVLEALLEGYRHILKRRFRPDSFSLYAKPCYDASLKIASQISYTEEDINRFCNQLNDSKNPDIQGIYITALAENILREYKKVTIRINKPVDFLGFMHHERTLIIEGVAGDYTGCKMEGGIIKVFGNSGYWTGNKMHDGKIEVYGDAGLATGERMSGGKIMIKGKMEGLGNIFHGEVWLTGKKLRLKYFWDPTHPY